MKPKLDAAQERRGIAENKRQRPGKRESARETMTGVEVTEIEYIHNWRYKEESHIMAQKEYLKVGYKEDFPKMKRSESLD